MNIIFYAQNHLQKLKQLTKWLLWFVTKVIVALKRCARWLVRGSLAWVTLKPGTRPRRTVRLLLLYARNWAYARPKIKVTVLSIVYCFPKVKAYLHHFHSANPIDAVRPADGFNRNILKDTTPPLTPRARQIYRQLKSVIANKNKQDIL